jgi:hypothetical protein
VLVPGIANLLLSTLEDCLNLADVGGGETLISRQLTEWIEPELGLAVRRGDVNVRPCFFSARRSSSGIDPL